MNIKATMALEVDRDAILNGGPLVERDRNNNITRQIAGTQMRAGEFYFVRRPEEIMVGEERPEKGFWKILWYVLLRKHRELKIVDVERVVIACPFDGLPIMTSDFHRIVKRAPLTIEGRIACPYAASANDRHAFAIVDGEIKIAAQ